MAQRRNLLGQEISPRTHLIAGISMLALSALWVVLLFADEYSLWRLMAGIGWLGLGVTNLSQYRRARRSVDRESPTGPASHPTH